jgi:hypothetical protein
MTAMKPEKDDTGAPELPPFSCLCGVRTRTVFSLIVHVENCPTAQAEMDRLDREAKMDREAEVDRG